MKKGKFILITLALLVIIASCKKSSSSPTIVGTWGLQSYKRSTIDSNHLAVIYNNDSTFADPDKYIYQFNSDHSFAFTDSLVTPTQHLSGTYLLSNGSIFLTASGSTVSDTIGVYTLSGNTLQITSVGSTPGSGGGPASGTLGSSFREIDTYLRQ